MTEKHIADEQSGLIIAYFGKSVAVETANGHILQCHLRRNQPQPIVGDQVRFARKSESTGIITQIEKRRSLLARGDISANIKPIAANIDAIIIVLAPLPIFSEYLIDRYLVAAELLTIPPLLVVHKMDLLDRQSKEALLERLLPYRHISYPCVLSSIMVEDGLFDLATYLKNKTSVLIGPSGVGKSSIIAAISKSDMIQIGEVTTKGAGKHTTTATRLYHLPDGGHLIDSPGIREFNLWQVSPQNIVRGFKEFQPFLTHCKFRDCLHDVEPGCAIHSALLQGKINSQRLASYQLLLKESYSRSRHK